MRLSCIVYILFFVSGCKSQIDQKPIWINEAHSISIPVQHLKFTSTEKNWEAYLQTFTQPIKLEIEYNDAGFTLSQSNTNGLIEGPAKICLRLKNTTHYYPVLLHNSRSGVKSEKKYCSPKTVNTDSSMIQQRLTHYIDQWCNLSYDIGSLHLFMEEDITIDTKAGSFQIQTENPLSTFYVQAGSPTDIPLDFYYDNAKNTYSINAGPMEDNFQNVISDGTLLSFIYRDSIHTYVSEAKTLNGKASLILQAEENKEYILKARINDIFSEPLILKIK